MSTAAVQATAKGGGINRETAMKETPEHLSVEFLGPYLLLVNLQVSVVQGWFLKPSGKELGGSSSMEDVNKGPSQKSDFGYCRNPQMLI